MRVASLVLGMGLMARLTHAGNPESGSVVSLQVSAQVGSEAWPLQPEHLELSCDGKSIPPSALRGADSPISVGIVLQPTRYMLWHVADIQAALRAFLGQIRQGDEVFTVKSLEHPTLGVGFTADPGANISSVSLRENMRHFHLYDGMDFALQHLQHVRNSSRALLVIFEADDLSSVVQAKAVRARILSAHIPTYVLSLYHRDIDSSDYLTPTLFELTRMAIDSGGDVWSDLQSTDLPRVVSNGRIRPGYLLDLRPSEECGSARVHTLKLGWPPGVAHRGVALRYQRRLPSLGNSHGGQ
jgi:hypothetical protein